MWATAASLAPGEHCCHLMEPDYLLAVGVVSHIYCGNFLRNHDGAIIADNDQNNDDINNDIPTDGMMIKMLPT